MKAVKKKTTTVVKNRIVTPATNTYKGYGDYVTSQYNKNTSRGRTNLA